MKLCLVLVAFLGVSLAAPNIHPRIGKIHPPKHFQKHLEQRDLMGDLDDILALIPLDEILQVLDAHLVDDPAVAAIVVYLQGDAWKALLAEVGAMQGTIDFLAYLSAQGVPVDDLLGGITDIIDNAVPGVEADNTASITPFLDEVLALVPLTDLLAILNDKLQNSVDFQNLYTYVATEGQPLVDAVLTKPEAVHIQEILTGMGVDVSGILSTIYGLFGWDGPPNALSIGQRDLMGDLDDILALIPLDEILQVLDAHLVDDPAVAAIVVYLQGDAWKALLAEVGAMQGTIDFLAYLTAQGVPVDDLLGGITDIIDNAVPGVEADNTASITPFLDEVLALVPLTDLLAILNDKLQNSVDFQNLYTYVATEGQPLVDAVLTKPEAVHIQEILTGMGVDVSGILSTIYGLFGWDGPPTVLSIHQKDLLTDFLDILGLIPLDQILEILDVHLTNDPAVAAIFIYLKGDAWNALIAEVGALQGTIDFLAYLTDKGVPIDVVLGVITGIIDSAEPGVEGDNTASITPFLDEVLALIPLTDLLAVLNEKLQNSVDFQELYTYISTEGQPLFDEVLTKPEAVHIQEVLTGMGVDVSGILSTIYGLFGWDGPPTVLSIHQKDLLTDFLDILGLIPLDQILEILDVHLTNDPAVAAIFIYLKGDAWNALIAEVGALQGTIDFLAYLTDKGVPIDVVLGVITGIIDSAEPGVEGDNTASITPFLDEVLALIPLTDLLAVLNEKLQNSVDFQELYTYISTEGQPLFDEVLTKPEAVHIQEVLTGMGVDVRGILTTIYGLFGWGEPPTVFTIIQKVLLDELMDFVNLLPLDEIIVILEDHVATDAAVSSVVTYLHGDAWAALVAQVSALEGTMDLIAYLETNGVPIELLIGAVTGLIDALEPGVTGDNTASLRPFLDHLESILPLTDLVNLLNEKMQNSADFQALYTFIATPDGKDLVDHVLVLTEVIRIREVLTGQGADVAGVLGAIYEFFSWGMPPK